MPGPVVILNKDYDGSSSDGQTKLVDTTVVYNAENDKPVVLKLEGEFEYATVFMSRAEAIALSAALVDAARMR